MGLLGQRGFPIKKKFQGFLDGSVLKNLPCNAGDKDLIPDLEDSTCCGATKPVHYNY